MRSFTIACLSDLVANLKRTLRTLSAGFLHNDRRNLDFLERNFLIFIEIGVSHYAPHSEFYTALASSDLSWRLAVREELLN